MATQMEHDQSSYLCRGPDDFCWGPAPVGPTLVTGPQLLLPNQINHYYVEGLEMKRRIYT